MPSGVEHLSCDQEMVSIEDHTQWCATVVDSSSTCRISLPAQSTFSLGKDVECLGILTWPNDIRHLSRASTDPVQTHTSWVA